MADNAAATVVKTLNQPTVGSAPGTFKAYEVKHTVHWGAIFAMVLMTVLWLISTFLLPAIMSLGGTPYVVASILAPSVVALYQWVSDNRNKFG